MATENFQGGGAVSFAPFLQTVIDEGIRQTEIRRQEQLAEQARYEKLYQSSVDLASKVSFEGIRKADQAKLYDFYNSEIKQKQVDAILARENGDMKKYVELLGEVNGSVQKLGVEIANSKTEATREVKLLEKYMEDPSRYSPEFREKFQQRTSLATSELTPELDYSSPYWEKQVDMSSVGKDLTKIIDDAWKSYGVLADVETRSVTAGGRGADVVTQITELPKERLGMALMQNMTNPALRTYMEQQYPGMELEEAVANYVEDLSEQGALRREDGRNVLRDQPINIRVGNNQGGEFEQGLTQTETVIPLQRGKEVNGGRATSFTQKQVLHSMRGIDAKTGLPLDVPGGEYTITQVVEVPIAKRNMTVNGQTITKGQLITSDLEGMVSRNAYEYEDHLRVVGPPGLSLGGMQIDPPLEAFIPLEKASKNQALAPRTTAVLNSHLTTPSRRTGGGGSTTIPGNNQQQQQIKFNPPNTVKFNPPSN